MLDELMYLILTGFVYAVVILVIVPIIMCAWPVILLCLIIFLLFVAINEYVTHSPSIEYESVEVSTKTRHVTFSREDFKNKNSPRYKFLRYLRKKGVYNVEQATIFFAKEGVDLEEEIACFEDLYKQKISEDFWDNKY